MPVAGMPVDLFLPARQWDAYRTKRNREVRKLTKGGVKIGVEVDYKIQCLSDSGIVPSTFRLRRTHVRYPPRMNDGSRLGAHLRDYGRGRSAVLGLNADGQLGDGSTSDAFLPVDEIGMKSRD